MLHVYSEAFTRSRGQDGGSRGDPGLGLCRDRDDQHVGGHRARSEVAVASEAGPGSSGGAVGPREPQGWRGLRRTLTWAGDAEPLQAQGYRWRGGGREQARGKSEGLDVPRSAVAPRMLKFRKTTDRDANEP